MLTIKKLALTILLVAVLGRGLWEVFVPKALAFVAQAATFGIAVIAVVSTRQRSIRFHRRSVTLFLKCALLAFGLAVALSYLVTSVAHPSALPQVYVAVSVFTVCWWALTIVVKAPPSTPTLVLIALGWAMAFALVVTALEVLGYWRPPGSELFLGFVRPAGITGAKQHHAILMGFMTFVLWECGARLAIPSMRILAVACALASLTSMTRSGAMVVIGGVAIAGSLRAWSILSHGGVFRRRNAVIVVGLTVVVVGTVAAIPSPPPWLEPYVERIVSAADLQAHGNVARTESWLRGLRELAAGPVFVGHLTGMVTNATRRLTDVQSFVVESGPLQQALNYGVIGMVAFYCIMGMTVAAIPKTMIWLRAGALAIIVNSFVYQSIEAFPVIVVYGMLPWIADALEQERTQGDDYNVLRA